MDGSAPCSTNGVWLLARLAVHHHLRAKLAVRVQEPLPWMGLRRGDRLEVARLSLALAAAKVNLPQEVR